MYLSSPAGFIIDLRFLKCTGVKAIESTAAAGTNKKKDSTISSIQGHWLQLSSVAHQVNKPSQLEIKNYGRMLQE